MWCLSIQLSGYSAFSGYMKPGTLPKGKKKEQPLELISPHMEVEKAFVIDILF